VRQKYRRAGVSRLSTRSVLVACIPAILLLSATFIIPIFSTVRLAFSKWPGVGPVKWVGLDNFSELFVNPDFRSSIRITFVYAILSTIGTMLSALLMGLAASRKMRSDEPLRAIWFLPAIAPGTAMAVFWTISVQPDIGVLNQILGKVGLGNAHSWLASPSTAMYVVIGVTIWASASFPFLLIVGAIDRIDPDILEAAKVDGAGELQQTRYFILPLIQPVLVMITLLQFIWNFNGFSLIWAMTRGGPVDGTKVLSVFQYSQAFLLGDFGTAAAIGLLGTVFLLALGMVGLRFAKSRTALQ
jgi:raffinose/stachyose/melibiose transport system permease protein